MADIEIKGIDELLKNLRKLPERVQNRVVVGAIRASAKPLISEARARVPVNTGNLKKSIGVTKRRSKNKNIIHFSVSPRKGGKYNGFYGHFLEFGTSKMSARPFLRPAFEAKGEETIEAAKQYMAKRIDKELSKL